jgi:hypothetical protein
MRRIFTFRFAAYIFDCAQNVVLLRYSTNTNGVGNATLELRDAISIAVLRESYDSMEYLLSFLTISIRGTV